MIRFDRVVVVSLARRPERLAAFLERAAAACPYITDNLDVEAAVDGQICQPPDWWKTTSGAWGCYRSHVRIIEDALQAGLESVLVFEDDATFVDGFRDKAVAFLEALPADWRQAYLGGQHLARPAPVAPGVVLGANVNRTHAYALRGLAGLQAAYRWLCASDRWRDRHHVDHQFGRLHRDGVLAAYAPAEWLCGQAADEASDVNGHPVRERWWQPQATRSARVVRRPPLESPLS
jgi:hypothetical protein